MRKRNALEWAVLATSVAAIAVLVAVLVAQGLSESRPANPQVTLLMAESRTAASGWILPAQVANAGHEPAEAVVLEATANIDGAEETSEMEIDFLPGGTTVEIAFAFSAQPQGQVTVRLVGYRTP